MWMMLSDNTTTPKDALGYGELKTMIPQSPSSSLQALPPQNSINL
jgi:hypothetical protein